jgi:hypothetical protein
MKTQTALNHKTEALRRIRTLYSVARTCHMTHKQILDRFTEIMDSVGHCPRWVKEYLYGWRDSLDDRLYADALEFCYRMPDGTIVSTYRKSDRYYEKLGYTTTQLIDCYHKYYWIGTDCEY